MSIIRSHSKIFEIVSGEHKGQHCVIRGLGKDGDAITIGIIFAESRDNQLLYVKRGELAQLDTPGWPDSFSCVFPASLEKYLTEDSIQLKIRDTYVVQPEVAKAGDELATNEIITEAPRRGFNSSVLLNLSKSGWVELAPRIPIALKGNTNYKLPIELALNDKLATGCVIVKVSNSTETSWTNIYLNRENCCIDTPSCIPLALA